MVAFATVAGPSLGAKASMGETIARPWRLAYPIRWVIWKLHIKLKSPLNRKRNKIPNLLNSPFNQNTQILCFFVKTQKDRNHRLN